MPTPTIVGTTSPHHTGDESGSLDEKGIGKMSITYRVATLNDCVNYLSGDSNELGWAQRNRSWKLLEGGLGYEVSIRWESEPSEEEADFAMDLSFSEEPLEAHPNLEAIKKRYSGSISPDGKVVFAEFYEPQARAGSGLFGSGLDYGTRGTGGSNSSRSTGTSATAAKRPTANSGVTSISAAQKARYSGNASNITRNASGKATRDKHYASGLYAPPAAKAAGGQGLGGEKMLTKNPMFGVKTYLSLKAVLRMTYTSSSPPSLSQIGRIVREVPGGFDTPSGHDWLLMPPKMQKKGAASYRITQEFLLSPPGGWPEEVYDTLGVI